MTPEFKPFPKMPRLAREIVITEKIDGTNGQVHVTEDGDVIAGSRTRWITPAEDNYGFARWVEEHSSELRELGPGSHFGEWWGAGIQRRYGRSGQGAKTFSLFNVARWGTERPACCEVVPTLYRGPFSERMIEKTLFDLTMKGSSAAPGFMDPEGIIVFHTAAQMGFKRTIRDDEAPKSVKAVAA